MHSEMRQPEVPQGVAIFGSDDNASIVLIYFDQRGVSRHYQVSINGSEMRWRRDDPKISQRMSFIVSADGKVIEQVGQMSEGGGPWQDDLTLTYHAVASEPTDPTVNGS